MVNRLHDAMRLLRFLMSLYHTPIFVHVPSFFAKTID